MLTVPVLADYGIMGRRNGFLVALRVSMLVFEVVLEDSACMWIRWLGFELFCEIAVKVITKLAMGPVYIRKNELLLQGQTTVFRQG